MIEFINRKGHMKRKGRGGKSELTIRLYLQYELE